METIYSFDKEVSEMKDKLIKSLSEENYTLKNENINLRNRLLNVLEQNNRLLHAELLRVKKATQSEN